MVAHGTPCLGPVTQAGCGALCPSFHRGCYGCFGPMESPNIAALHARLARLGVDGRRDRPPDAHLRRRSVRPASHPEGARTMTHKSLDLHVPTLDPRRRRRGDARRRTRRRGRERRSSRSTSRHACSRRSCAAGPTHEPVDITARICGICPVAYQMSAPTRSSTLAGVTVDGPIRDLRRLLYCGEWIESHVLHMAFLHAPDFLGVDSGIDDRPASTPS